MSLHMHFVIITEQLFVHYYYTLSIVVHVSKHSLFTIFGMLTLNIMSMAFM